MPLVERDELRSEAEADDGDVDAIFFGHEEKAGATGGLRRRVKPPHARGVKAFAYAICQSTRRSRDNCRAQVDDFHNSIERSRKFACQKFACQLGE
jgi:hypothetical protein